MKIGILGTGNVGSTIGNKLIELGHEVMMGSRTIENEKATNWASNAGKNALNGTFADTAKFGEILFNCTSGSISIDALNLAGKENLKGKILIDLANPLDFSKGMPPSLYPQYANTTSLGEEIQKTFPETKVVKTLNTMNCNLMVNAKLVPGDHDVFIGGNDEVAKMKVKEILKEFGWHSPIDLGDITSARGTEMILPLWVRLMSTFKTAAFNFKVVKP